MKNEIDYLKINKHSWNNKTDVHYDSEFYDNDNFIKGKSSLNEIELALLPDLKGKSILHLQCHFGQDTISFSRLGAKATGVDLSDAAIEKAIGLNKLTKTDAEFICCDIYDLPNHLDGQFDMVFTSYGTIGWLPDLNKWANIVAHFLKPNGQFLIAEFHPFVWMFDDDFKFIKYNYFNDGPIMENETGTYTDKDADITQDYVMWNHPMSDVVSSLLANGLEINGLHEYDYSPYNCFNETVEFEPKKFRIKHMDNKIPMVYAIEARKKGGNE